MNNGLRGNRRIIYEELLNLLKTDTKITYADIADRANCDPRTVKRAVEDLRMWGMIMTYYRRGRPLEYKLCLRDSSNV